MGFEPLHPALLVISPPQLLLELKLNELNSIKGLIVPTLPIILMIFYLEWYGPLPSPLDHLLDFVLPDILVILELLKRLLVGLVYLYRGLDRLIISHSLNRLWVVLLIIFDATFLPKLLVKLRDRHHQVSRRVNLRVEHWCLWNHQLGLLSLPLALREPRLIKIIP